MERSFPAPEWYQPNRYYTTAQNLVTTTITASGGAPAEPIGSHRTERWGRLEGDELYPRGNHLGSSLYLTRRVLDPGTGCPASWTAPPELSEDRPTGGAVQARPAVGPFGAPLFHLSHSPSDMGLPRSTLRWALVHVCACRQIHLYGESKKSTHGHQTHLPARTHQRQMASGLSPRPHQPAAHGRKSLG